MKAVTVAALLAIIAVSISVMWVDARWPVTLAEVPLFALALAWTFRILVHRERPVTNIVLIPLAAGAIWIGLQILAGFTVYQSRTELALLYWLCGAATVFIGLQVFSDSLWRARFLRALMWLSFAVCVVSLLQYFTGNDRIFGFFATGYDPAFIFGPFVYHSQFAAFVELTLPIALYGTLRSGQISMPDSLVVAVLYTCIVISASRGGFILATLEILAVPALMLSRGLISQRRTVASGLVVLAMAVFLVLAANPARLFSRFALTDTIRPEFNRSSLAILRDHPFTGVGLGNWAVVYPAYARFDDGLYANQAHDDWAQWAAEGGLPFAVMIFGIALWAFHGAIRSIWGIGVPVIFLHCLIDYPIQRIGVAIVFFALIAAMAGEESDLPTNPPAS